MKLRIAVLFGGKSTEHEISVISALQAMENMDPEQYEIFPVYIAKNSVMYFGNSLRNIQKYRDIPALLKESEPVTFAFDGTQTRLVRAGRGHFGKKDVSVIDLAFPIVHGTNVEDGTLAGYLKTVGLPVVGCDVLASAVGMDKYVMKQYLAAEGFPVLPAIRLSSAEYGRQEEAVAKAEEKIGYPMIVKPVNLGSSIGISKAADREKLINALDLAFTFSDIVIIEKAITALKEVNCSVLGDDDLAEASALEEPFANDEILSYKDKYIDGNGSKGGKGGSSGNVSSGMASLKRKIPADIPGETAALIRDLAVRSFHSLGCSGVVRIDFMIDLDSGSVYINEINTIPGSLAFYLWEPAGLTYRKMLDRLVAIALKRARSQAGLTYSFSTNVFSLGSGFGGAKGSKGGSKN
ncbi:MAG: D-alanine--D-alanine ligase [Clostridia bacterium]|nr:D-alanine--D-alanine ligase [Clostridia bacterium]